MQCSNKRKFFINDSSTYLRRLDKHMIDLFKDLLENKADLKQFYMGWLKMYCVLEDMNTLVSIT